MTKVISVAGPIAMGVLIDTLSNPNLAMIPLGAIVIFCLLDYGETLTVETRKFLFYPVSQELSIRAQVEAVDHIIVLDSGSVVEQGNHTELLAARGTYASLWETQSESP